MASLHQFQTLDLEMESGANVKVNGILQRYDHNESIESWVFSMRGDAVAGLFKTGGIRLFARNIRGYLGVKTPVNDGMIATLRSEPHRFFYYNNGVTIICDHAEKRSHKGTDILQISNPQVINGQQTTRTLAANPDEAAKATVLVKVIQIPRSPIEPTIGFESLISSIVQGTNWQNAIKASDLMANDRIQIGIEREPSHSTIWPFATRWATAFPRAEQRPCDTLSWQQPKGFTIPDLTSSGFFCAATPNIPFEWPLPTRRNVTMGQGRNAGQKRDVRNGTTVRRESGDICQRPAPVR